MFEQKELESLRVELHDTEYQIAEIDTTLENIQMSINRARSNTQAFYDKIFSLAAPEQSPLYDLLRNELRIIEKLSSSLQTNVNQRITLDSRMCEILSVIKAIEPAVPRIPPDSQRMDELLASEVSLHRDGSTDSLVRVHLANWKMRQAPMAGGGSEDLVPLMDSPFGRMNKTSYSARYLALVARNKANYSEYDVRFLNELLNARTIRVTFPAGSLAYGTPLAMSERFVSMLYDAVRSQWGVECPAMDTIDPIGEALKWISNVSNSFIILDEIGVAFSPTTIPDDDEDLKDSMNDQKNRFLSFIALACIPMLQTNGMYFLLSGEFKFLSTVVPLAPNGSCHSLPLTDGRVQLQRILLFPKRRDPETQRKRQRRN